MWSQHIHASFGDLFPLSCVRKLKSPTLMCKSLTICNKTFWSTYEQKWQSCMQRCPHEFCVWQEAHAGSHGNAHSYDTRECAPCLKRIFHLFHMPNLEEFQRFPGAGFFHLLSIHFRTEHPNHNKIHWKVGQTLCWTQLNLPRTTVTNTKINMYPALNSCTSPKIAPPPSSEKLQQ